MSKPGDYEEAIQRLDWGGLRSLWDSIGRDKTPGWEDGKALEYLVLRNLPARWGTGPMAIPRGDRSGG